MKRLANRLSAIRQLFDQDFDTEENEPVSSTDGGSTDHLREVPDGAGCTEIWEHIAERDRHNGDE